MKERAIVDLRVVQRFRTRVEMYKETDDSPVMVKRHKKPTSFTVEYRREDSDLWEPISVIEVDEEEEE